MNHKKGQEKKTKGSVLIIDLYEETNQTHTMVDRVTHTTRERQKLDQEARKTPERNSC